ncbi:MAG: Gfo/Idh/MocA family oxidoreductase [Clostridia bacterium]|nr:Gfo/Idh/MocA family oxidoreductase [Clostridia bacterium]
MANFAMLGKWHVHAPGYAMEAKEAGGTCKAVWDPDFEVAKEWAAELGCEAIECLDELLARDDIDSVLIGTTTATHHEVIMKAAKAKKHIFTEKTLAPTVAECEDMAKAISDAGVLFAISYPMRTAPTTLYAKQIVESGVLGQISLGRFRNAHGGSAQGWLPEYWYVKEDACGGAMMDLGCHPMYIAAYLFGKPTRINSMYNSLYGRDIDDNAVNTIEFENKAIAIVETSFVTPYCPWNFEIHGTKGSLFGTDDKIYITTEATREETGSEDPVEVKDLPASLTAPVRNFIDAVDGKATVHFGINDAIDLARLLENAYIADAEGITVVIK